jgi:rubrerythrin
VITRRTALVTGAAALVVAGCGGRSARTVAGNPADLRILNAALDTERKQIAFYEAGLRLRDTPALKKILSHEHAHAAAIEEAIRELGGTPPAPSPIARYSLARGFDAWRQDAIGREEQWSAGYAALIPKLTNPRLRATFGALATTEAEHAGALDVRA